MAAEPLLIGPQGWHDGSSILEEVVDWTSRWLVQPDGPEAGEPWAFTEQQLKILDHWFAYDSESGRWLYRRGTLRMMKGWGKDPIAAVLAMLELCGPSRVERQNGLWTVQPHRAPWVDIAAVAREQTKNTMRVFPSLVPKRTIAEYGLDMNKEIIYRSGGGTIQAVTSSPYALEGGRATLVLRNETQYWFSTNDGHEMAEVIDGNLAKSRDGAARALSLCNAHVPGEDSVGEREWDAYQAMEQGRTKVKDLLYVAVEAPPSTDLADEASLRSGLEGARGDSLWLDVDRLINEVWDPRTPPTEARRKYLNQIVAAEDALFAPHEWNACAVRGVELEPGEQITMGFDGSKSEDHTGLVATRVSDGMEFVLGWWDPALHGGEVPRSEVDAVVARCFKDYDVVMFYADLHPFESYVDEWEREFGKVDRFRGLCAPAHTKHAIAWDMRARQREFVLSVERTHAEVLDQQLHFQAHAGLTTHALNARRRIDRFGMGFGKETAASSRKVDLLAAMVLSRLAWHDYIALPRSKRRRPRSGKAQFI